MHELTTWLDSPHADSFPYDAVVDEFCSAGKHFVSGDLLAMLASARATSTGGSYVGKGLLARFMKTALDKWDRRFDNPSYLALNLLPMPGNGHRRPDLQDAEEQRDRLFALLVTDILRFEIAAVDGHDRLPHLRPPARVVAKRCRLAVRAVLPVLRRLGLDPAVTSTDSVDAAREVCAAVAADTTPGERRMLALSALTVSQVHDEYMFVRVLQSYETTFALAVVCLSVAIEALRIGQGDDAVQAIDAAEQSLREASLLFSVVATMQPEAFLTFREFTDGASAIQSRNYKLIESLCRMPDPDRLDSPAFSSVPEVRERIIAGLPNLSDAADAADDAVLAAMHRFGTTFERWRKTHYRVALTMLGERRGTGYTEGVPYLATAREIPVFDPAVRTRGCPFGYSAA
ncbi:tryptophan 2,3-dioxygenase family protein [Antrihabitans stalactiti]|uniref:Tryptophan 2,3-dioxygenase n=1 Tax=Antrihabitans stalactiti TaxID=2584121 RepID=A0A848KGR5_9NOCA|nr:tryptophan 2,3-dioxygenase family protein [Antrihabitans stalactiti]NMN95400.1 tryptophan 2,3-dioxygenase [Antrihabitans stalactiti]